MAYARGYRRLRSRISDSEAHTDIIQPTIPLVHKSRCNQKNYAEQVTVTAKEAPKPQAAFSSEEVAKLWSSLNQHEYISIILMLIYSGVRISELLDLKKEDVLLEEQWFSVRHSKTEAGVRAVPIADKVLPFWQSFMDKSKSPYAVCTESGQKLNYDNFIRAF